MDIKNLTTKEYMDKIYYEATGKARIDYRGSIITILSILIKVCEDGRKKHSEK